MNDKKIKEFFSLAGQDLAKDFETGDAKKRELGAQLLLSETLEYVIKGLGVIPSFGGSKISDANGLEYKSTSSPDKTEMLDGLSDVAYTMFWNSVAFGIPLEEAFELVCDNNLEKFVELREWNKGEGEVEKNNWHLEQDTSWPESVSKVEVIKLGDKHYGVGKDKTGKVRKPSSYKSVDLSGLI